MYLNTIRDMWQILSAAQHPGDYFDFAFHLNIRLIQKTI